MCYNQNSPSLPGRRNDDAQLCSMAPMKYLFHALLLPIVAFCHVATVSAQTVALTPERTGHAATLLPNGKVLITGGVNENTTLASAVLYDPTAGSFTSTGPMNEARASHTSTLLPDGRVLIAGGENSVTLRSAEIYDPATGVFTETPGRMGVARSQHTATLLQNGKVLLVGGLTADLFDPASETFTATIGTPVDRRSHAALLFPDGTVFLTGGYVGAAAVDIAEIYNPAAQSFTQLTPGMIIPRANHTMTRLLDGTVLIAGGFSGTSPHDEVESYNPTTHLFSSKHKMSYHRSNHRALLLAGGKVVVIGGVTLESGFLAVNEVYDPTTDVWSTHSVLLEDRAGHTATGLPNGDILVAGGVTGNSTLQTAEILDPTTHVFTSLGNMVSGRNQHTATLLPSGKLLLVGGSTDTVTLRASETFNPATNTFSAVGPLGTARKSHTATLLQNGKVLVTGGKSVTGDLASAELFDPATALFTKTGSLKVGRALHTANLLNDGKTLVAGGVITGGDETPTAELYDPTLGTFTFTGSLNLKRKRHRANLLLDGTVLFTGGNSLDNSQQGGDRTTETAELYNPTAGTFSMVQDMHSARSEHEATLLTDGTVVVTGGTLTSAAADIYLPMSETFDTAGEMVQTRGRHVALRLTNPAWGNLLNKVLIFGGDITGGPVFGGAQQAIDSVELYDPATGLFSTFGTMLQPRQNHTATELQDGRILIAGGVGRPFISATAETIPGPVASPTPTPSGTPTPSPTGTPTPTATVTPTPTATVTPSVTPTPTVPPGKPLNISTRIQVQSGDNALIGGFIINGGTAPKKVIVRVIGPSLAQADPPVQGFLANPTLALHFRDGSVIINDNWRSRQEQEIIDSGLAPKNDLESAIIATLPPVDPNISGSGQYTAVVTGANGGSGVALVEVYDLDDQSTAQSVLANISSRGLVQTGDDVMIGGFIIGPAPGETPILVRAIGPSLAAAQIADPLQDPTLELHDGNGGLIASNDDWADTNEAAISATGLAPKSAKESAILAPLAPGNYTAVVRGKSASGGVALVEIFYLP